MVISVRNISEIFKSNLNSLINSRANGNQSGFARLVEVPQSQIAKWLNSTNSPGIESLEKMSNRLGIPAASLISEGELPKVVTREPTNDDILAKISVALNLVAKLSPELVDRLSRADEEELSAVMATLESYSDPFREDADGLKNDRKRTKD